MEPLTTNQHLELLWQLRHETQMRRILEHSMELLSEENKYLRAAFRTRQSVGRPPRRESRRLLNGG